MQNYEHPFSWEALTRIVVMGIIVILCWKALGALPVILVAIVLAAAFYPIVKKVQAKTNMHLLLCIFLVLVVPLIPIIYVGFIFIPRIISDLPILFGSLNTIVGRSSLATSFFGNFNLITYIQSHFDYANATINIAFVSFSVITTIFLTFFLIYDFERLFELLLHIVPGREKTKIRELFEEVATVIGKFVRGNAILSLLSCVVIYVGLSLLNVPFALPLAVFAALIDLLPIVGQTIGAIPAVIIGFGISPMTGLLVIILNVVYQQIENSIISPMIYNKALNLIPSISFLSVILGASLFGVLGAFLALPFAASIPAIMEYHKSYKIRHGDL